MEGDAGKKANLEKQLKTDQATYDELDKDVTARRSKWNKMQQDKKERDGKKKAALAAAKKRLGDNVVAAKSEFEAA